MCNNCHCHWHEEYVDNMNILSDFWTSTAKIEEVAPFFDLPFWDPKTDKNSRINLDELEGKWSVLFFYPADFTFVCPTELKDIAEQEEKFKKLWVEVLTVSTDTVFTHKAWVENEAMLKNFPYKMLADHTWEVAEKYNILDEVTGMASRWTFIISPDLTIKGIEVTCGPLWRNSQELIRKIEALQYIEKNPGQWCPAKWIIWENAIDLK